MFFLQAEDGIRDLVRSRGLGDVYKRQRQILERYAGFGDQRLAGGFERFGDADGVDNDVVGLGAFGRGRDFFQGVEIPRCLLYTSDAADERSSVDLGGGRIIKKKKHRRQPCSQV